MTIAHHTFTMARTYPHPPAAVFDAWVDPAKKALWFGTSPGLEVVESASDIREGGSEHARTVHHDGIETAFDASYVSIAPSERIVYTYTMTLNGKPLSASAAAVTFAPVEGGTLLTVTEHGIHLDGIDDGDMREQGTASLLDGLGTALDDLARE